MLLTSLLLAFALVLIVEGVGPLLFTSQWRRMVLTMSMLPVNKLQRYGGIMVVVGVVLIWAVLR